MHLHYNHRHSTSFHRKLRSYHLSTVVVLGVLCLCNLASSDDNSGVRVARKLSSPLEPDVNGQIPTEELHSLLSLLEGRQKKDVLIPAPTQPGNNNEEATSSRASPSPAISPELTRTPSPQPATLSTTTQTPPVSRVTARRYFRRLRRKTTPVPTTGQESSTTVRVTERRETGRMLPTSSGEVATGDLVSQLSLLNGILGALNSTTDPTASASLAQPSNNAPAKNNETNPTSVPDLLAILAGAKADASSTSQVVVPPPQSPSPSGQVDDQTKNALALLNLFSSGENQNNNAGNSAANLVNLFTQPQTPPAPPQQTVSETDATAALTKLLLQSSLPANQPVQGNSILQQQPQPQSQQDSANQLTNLLGLLGTLGAAAGGGQQSHAGSINNLFNLGGDQQAAQAQTANSLANLFGGNTQQQQQQNLLNLLGGNQGGGAAQGFSLANFLAPQAGGAAIPGLGLLTTMSSLGSSLFSTMSNIFGGSRLDGKPRVRGKGVDTRLGLGYRLGNVGDAQIVWDIGPQLFTDPLRNEIRYKENARKRESGMPSPYPSPASSSIASEKETQQIEAKRRMVHAAIKDHYKGNDYYNYNNQFSSLSYPTYRRTQRDYDPRTTIKPYQSYQSYEYPAVSSSPPAPTKQPTTAPASIFSSIPLVDHIRGFWTGLTSNLKSDKAEEKSEAESSPATSYFDDVRSEFSQNLIKRSSPYFEDYEQGSSNRRMDDYDRKSNSPSTLTDYERMLLKYGKDIGIGGVANTKSGVAPESETKSQDGSESGIFSRWFKPPAFLSSLSGRGKQEAEVNNNQEDDWRHRSMATSSSNEYPVASRPPYHPKSDKKSSQQYEDVSFNRRNDGRPHSYPRRNGNNKNGQKKPPRRRSHNPFRHLFNAFKSSGSSVRYHQRDQRPRASQQSQFSGGFGRRHFKRPGGNPKLQHFTNTNKDLMMADANTADDFVQTAGVESLPGAYEQSMSYYGSEFPDVSLTSQPKRIRPSQMDFNSAIPQREEFVEPALLYDHLETVPKKPTKPEEMDEMDESFHNRNKVVLNAKLREMEKQKILGTPRPVKTQPKTKIPHQTMSKLHMQRLRLNKLRQNSTINGGKQKVVVKVKGSNNHYKTNAAALAALKDGKNYEEDSHVAESSTALPSVLSTIGSIFSGTTKPKLLNNLIHNATSFLPNIGAIRILPRKKKNKKDQKTRLTVQNGKPTIMSPPEEDDLDAEGDEEPPPVVQVGHDMSFTDLQSIFGASKNNNSTKRRFRIRVKESVIKGEDDKEDKERKDQSDEEEDEETRDIFVDIESGEVSVLKPVASLVSFVPKKEEASKEEVEIDYYEDDDGDGVADHDMKRKEHIFDAIQKELVRNFEKMKKAELRAQAKQRRKEELAKKGMDESMDHVTKLFDIHQVEENAQGNKHEGILHHAGGLLL